MPGVTEQSGLPLAAKGGEMPAWPPNNFGGTEKIPHAGMRDISWLLSLSSRQSSGPQLCLRTLTGYVTRCPSDIFPGRESEYEMIVLFTSYLWHCLSCAAGSTDRATIWQCCPPEVVCLNIEWRPRKPSLLVSLEYCYTEYFKNKRHPVPLCWFDAVLIA